MQIDYETASGRELVGTGLGLHFVTMDWQNYSLSCRHIMGT